MMRTAVHDLGGGYNTHHGMVPEGRDAEHIARTQVYLHVMGWW